MLPHAVAEKIKHHAYKCAKRSAGSLEALVLSSGSLLVVNCAVSTVLNRNYEEDGSLG